MEQKEVQELAKKLRKPEDFGTFGRYREVPIAEMNAEMKGAYDYTVQLRGLVPGPHKIWLANARLSRTIVPVGAYYQKGSTLSKAEIEIVTILINARWLSAYGTYEHEGIGELLGHLQLETVQRMIGGQTVSFADERQQIVYDLASALVQPRIVSAGLYQRAKQALGDAGIVDVAVLIGWFTMVSSSAFALLSCMAPMRTMHSVKGASVDRLLLLEVFLSLAETKSITDTARRLEMSQSTVSRMLQRLESIAEVLLVRRASRGVSLTREGEQLARSAPGILESWSAALECGRKANQRLSGTLRVVAPVAIGQGMLATVFSRFLLQHPGLSLELELRDDPIDLQAMKYDLWIRVGAAPDSLVVQHIFKINRLLVAAPGVAAAEHPQALAQVRAIRLRPFTPRAIQLTHSSGQSFKLAQNVALTSDHLETVRVAALEGVGYAVLPLWAVKRDLKENKLVRLCAAWQPPSLRLSLAFLPNAKRSAGARELILFIRNELTRPDGAGMSYLRRRGIADTIQDPEGVALAER